MESPRSHSNHDTWTTSKQNFENKFNKRVTEEEESSSDWDCDSDLSSSSESQTVKLPNPWKDQKIEYDDEIKATSNHNFVEKENNFIKKVTEEEESSSDWDCESQLEPSSESQTEIISALQNNQETEHESKVEASPNQNFVTKANKFIKTQVEESSSDWDCESELESSSEFQAEKISAPRNNQEIENKFEASSPTSTRTVEEPTVESPTSDFDLALDELELDILDNYYIEPEPAPLTLDPNSHDLTREAHHQNGNKPKVPTKIAMDFFQGSFTDEEIDEENRVKTLTRSVDVSPSPRCCSPLAALTMNMSFAGCGFLGIYHLGVAHALAHHGHKLMLNVQRFGGASAGSLVACALAVRGTDKKVIEECIDFCYSLAETVQNKKLGVLTPRLCLLKPLRNFLDQMLPPDAHLIAKSRLFVSITDAATKKNHLVSEYDSKEQLIQYLLASSYVPFVTGKKPVKVNGQKYLDGGMTDNLPCLPSGRTIYVTPFSGRQDICPVDKDGRGWYVNLQGEDFQVNKNNLKRGYHAFFPPKRREMDLYFQRGKNDAIRFLKNEHFYSEEEDEGNFQKSDLERTQTVTFEDQKPKTSEA